jgi:AraC family transcriptional regulator, positive regulator of tynA and feaB
MANFVTVSTATMPPNGQATEWSRAIGECFSEWFGGPRFRTTALGPFRGRIDYTDVGQIRICRLAAQAHHMESVPGDALTPSRYKLTIQLEGNTVFEQDGLSARLTPGHWTMYDTARPYLMNAPQAIHVAIVTIPKELIRLTLTERCALVQPLSTNVGSGLRLSRNVIDRLRELEVSSNGDVVLAACPFEQELAAQIKSALQEQISASRRTLHPKMLRARIIDYIEQNLADPDLTVDRIAHDLNCSKRYLHTVFDSESTTLVRYIQQLRLSRICRDLGNPTLRQHSITRLAVSWGFVSPGHFSRTFKEAFGMTPRDYRARGAQTRPVD